MPQRILIAWELGGNLGHRARCLALARALDARDIEPVLALRDLRGVSRTTPFPILQATRLNPSRHDPRSHPANYADLLLAVGYGGGGTMCEVLLAGVPLLLMPHHVEQVLASHCLQRHGAAHVIGRDRSPPAIAEALDHALHAPQLRFHAQRFAQDHVGYRSEHSIEHAVRHILQRLGTAPACRRSEAPLSQTSTTP